MSTIAFTLVGSILSPSDVATCPINRTSSCLSLNLSTFSLTPRSSHRCRNEWSRLSWSTFASSTVLPTTKSSATTSIPCSPSISSCIFFWKTSGAELMPNGMRLYRYLPKGVWKVVRYDDRSSRCMCQNPWRTSRTVNTLALCSRVVISSIVSSWQFSRRIADLDPSDRDRCEVCCLSS